MISSKLASDMRNWRQYLHQNPEFGFDENNTSQFVVDRLQEFGLEDIETGVGGTGVVATLRGGNKGKTIALRADMDCLRIHETTNLPYSSSNPGLMHACGHDGHTAILLGAAAVLAAEGGYDGTVRFIFQPAEEWGQGMKAMMRDGLGKRLTFDEIYGLHNMPGLPVGSFAIRPGPFMGAEDGFKIHVQGNGGHASRPQESQDAIVCACSIVTELQMIVSRNIDPSELAVVSVTSILGDNVKNAIASEAWIEGDCRHFSDEVSQQIESTLRRISSGVAAAHGCDADITYDRVFVPLVNDAEATAHAIEAAVTVFGPDNLNGNAARLGASEDFAQALSAAPGAFGFFGNGESASLHSAGYDFNDAALETGVEWFVEIVKNRLPAETKSGAS